MNETMQPTEKGKIFTQQMTVFKWKTLALSFYPVSDTSTSKILKYQGCLYKPIYTCIDVCDNSYIYTLYSYFLLFLKRNIYRIKNKYVQSLLMLKMENSQLMYLFQVYMFYFKEEHYLISNPCSYLKTIFGIKIFQKCP